MTVELVLCTQELCEKGACGTFRVEVGKDRYVVSACRIVFISGSVDYMKYKIISKPPAVLLPVQGFVCSFSLLVLSSFRIDGQGCHVLKVLS